VFCGVSEPIAKTINHNTKKCFMRVLPQSMEMREILEKTDDVPGFTLDKQNSVN